MYPKVSRTVGWHSRAPLLVLVGSLTAFTFSLVSLQAADARADVVTGRVLNAATGQYLTNARVSVAGTELVAFTDQSGIYHLVGVPGGALVLHVFYTGLEPQDLSIHAPAGGVVAQDVSLVMRTEDDHRPGVVRLKRFVVSDSPEMDAESIAINDQRFSPNIKNVVAAGSFGDIAEGNVGEFIQYLPTVSPHFADPTIPSISVRRLAT